MPNKVNEFQILNADDTELMRISQEGTLSLNLNEMQTIQSHFAALQRNRCRAGQSAFSKQKNLRKQAESRII